MSETLPSSSNTPDGEDSSGSYSYSYTESVYEENHRGCLYRVSLARLAATGAGSDFHHETTGAVAELPNVRCAFYLSTHHTPSPSSSSLSTSSDESESEDTESTHAGGASEANTAAPVASPSPSKPSAPPTDGADASPVRTTTTTAAAADQPAASEKASPAVHARTASDITDDDVTEDTYRPHYPWRVESTAAEKGGSSSSTGNPKQQFTVTDVDIQVSETEDATLIATVQLGVDLLWSFIMSAPDDGAASTNVWLVCEIIDEVMDNCALKCAIPLPAHERRRLTDTATASGPTPVRAVAERPSDAKISSETRRTLFDGSPGKDESDAEEAAGAADAQAAQAVSPPPPPPPAWEKIPFVKMFDTGARSRRSAWYLRCRVEAIQHRPSVTRRSETTVSSSRQPPLPERQDSVHATASSAVPPPPAEVPSPTQTISKPPTSTTAPVAVPVAVPSEDVAATEAAGDQPPLADRVSRKGDDGNEDGGSSASSVVSSTSSYITPSLRTAATGMATVGASVPESSRTAGEEPHDDEEVRRPFRLDNTAAAAADKGHPTDNEEREEDEEEGREETTAPKPSDDEPRYQIGQADDAPRTPNNTFVEEDNDEDAPGKSARSDGHDSVAGGQPGREIDVTDVLASPGSPSRLAPDDGVSPLPRKPRTPSPSASSTSSASSRVSSSPRSAVDAKTAGNTGGDAVLVAHPTAASPPAVMAAVPDRTQPPAVAKVHPPVTTYLPDDAIVTPPLVTVDGARPEAPLLLPRLNLSTHTPSGSYTAAHPQLEAEQLDLFERTPSSTTSSILSSSTITSTSGRGVSGVSGGASSGRDPRATAGSPLAAASGTHDDEAAATVHSSSRSRPFASSPFSSTHHHEDDEEDADEEVEVEVEDGGKDRNRSSRDEAAQGHSLVDKRAGEGEAPRDQRPRHSHRARRPTLDEVLASHRDDDIVPYAATQPRPPAPPLSAHESREGFALVHRASQLSSSSLSPGMLSSSEVRERRDSATHRTTTTATTTNPTHTTGDDASSPPPPKDSSSPDVTAPHEAPAGKKKRVSYEDAQEEQPQPSTRGATADTEESYSPSAAASAPVPREDTRVPTSTASVPLPGSDASRISPVSEDPLAHPLTLSSDPSARQPLQATPPRVVEILSSGDAEERQTSGKSDSHRGGGHIPIGAQQSFTSANQFTSSAPVSPKSVTSNRRTTAPDEDFLTYNTDPIGQGMHLMHFARLPLDSALRRSVDGLGGGGGGGGEAGSPRPPRSPRAGHSLDGSNRVSAGGDEYSNEGSPHHRDDEDQVLGHSGSAASVHSHSSYSYSYSDDDYSYSYSDESGASSHAGDGGGEDADTATHREGSRGSPSRRSRHSRHRAPSSGANTVLPRGEASPSIPSGVAAARPSLSPQALTSFLTSDDVQASSKKENKKSEDAKKKKDEGNKDENKKEDANKPPQKSKKEGGKGFLCCRRGAAKTSALPLPLEALYQCVTEKVARAPPVARPLALGTDDEESHDEDSDQANAHTAGVGAPPPTRAAAVPILHAEHICLFRLPSPTTAASKAKTDARPAADDVGSDGTTTAAADAETGTADDEAAGARDANLSHGGSAVDPTGQGVVNASLTGSGNTALLLAENMRRLINKLSLADAATAVTAAGDGDGGDGGGVPRPSMTSVDSALMRSALDERIDATASAAGAAAAATTEQRSDEGDDRGHHGATQVSAHSIDERPFLRAEAPTTPKRDESSGGGGAATGEGANAAGDDAHAAAADAAAPSGTRGRRDTSDTLPPLALKDAASPSQGSGTVAAGVDTLPQLAVLDHDHQPGGDEEDEHEMELGMRSKTAGPSLPTMPCPSDADTSPAAAAAAAAADDAAGGESCEPETTKAPPSPPLPPLFACVEVAALPPLWASDEVEALPYLYAWDSIEPLPYLCAFAFVAALPYLSAWDAQPPWEKPAPLATLRSLVPPSPQRFFFFVRLAGLARVAGVLSDTHSSNTGNAWEKTQLRISLLARRHQAPFLASSASWRIASGSVFSVPSSPAALRGAASNASHGLRDEWSDVLIFCESALNDTTTTTSTAHQQPVCTVGDDSHAEPLNLDELEVYVQVERCTVRQITRTCTRIASPPAPATGTTTTTPANPRAAESTRPTEGPEMATTASVTTSPPQEEEEASQPTLLVSLSDRAGHTTADSSIVFQSEPSTHASLSAPAAEQQPPSVPASTSSDVIASSSSSSSPKDDEDDLSPDQPPQLRSTKLPDNRCTPTQPSTSSSVDEAAETAEQPPPQREADNTATTTTQTAVPESQAIDWNYYEVVWEPLSVSPAVSLRALQEAAAAFTLHADTAATANSRSKSTSDTPTTSSALQSSFPLPLRATRALCASHPQPAHQLRDAHAATTMDTVLEGEDVLWGTVSVCHSASYYNNNNNNKTHESSDDDDDDDTIDDLNKAASRLGALSHAIAEYQPGDVRAGPSTAGPDRGPVGFETTHTSLFGAAARPLTVLWDTMPESDQHAPPETAREQGQLAAAAPRMGASGASSLSSTAAVPRTVRPGCCSVVLRCGVVVLEQVAHLAQDSPLPLVALSVSSAHGAGLVTAKPQDVSCAAPAYLQQAPVMRYDVAVQAVLTASTNPALLVTVHSAFAKETVFGAACFTPFQASPQHRSWWHAVSGTGDVWLPLYASAQALRTAADSGKTTHQDRADSPVLTSAAAGPVRVGWVHCDVEYLFSATSRNSGGRSAMATMEEAMQIEQCVWKRTDALERAALSTATAGPSRRRLGSNATCSPADLVDVTILAGANLFSASGDRYRACNTFCEVEVLKKKKKKKNQSKAATSDADWALSAVSGSGQPDQSDISQLSVGTASTTATATTATSAATANTTARNALERTVGQFPVTATVPHSNDPVWDHTFRLSLAGGDVRAVVVRVFDCAQGSGSPQLLGTVTLSPNTLGELCVARQQPVGVASSGAVWFPVLPTVASTAVASDASGRRCGDGDGVAALLIAASSLSPWGRSPAPLAHPNMFLTRGLRLGTTPWSMLASCQLSSRTRPLLLPRTSRDTNKGSEEAPDTCEAPPLWVPRALTLSSPSSSSSAVWYFAYRHVCVTWPWLSHVLRLHGGVAHLIVERLPTSRGSSDLFSAPPQETTTMRMMGQQCFTLALVSSDEDRLRLLAVAQPNVWGRKVRRAQRCRARHTAAEMDETHASCTSAFTIDGDDSEEADSAESNTASSPAVFCGAATPGLRYRVLHVQPDQPRSQGVVLGAGEWRAPTETCALLTVDASQTVSAATSTTLLPHHASANVDVLLSPLTAQWTAPMVPTRGLAGEQVLMPWTPSSASDGRALTYPHAIEPGVLSFQIGAFPRLPLPSGTCPSGEEEVSAWGWPEVGVVAFIELSVEDWVAVPNDSRSRGACAAAAAEEDDDDASCIPMSAERWGSLGLSACEAMAADTEAAHAEAATVWTSRAASLESTSEKETLHLEWPARRFPWFSRDAPVVDLRWHVKTPKGEEGGSASTTVGVTRVRALESFTAQSGQVWLPFYTMPDTGSNRQPGNDDDGVTNADAVVAVTPQRHAGFVRVRYQHNFIRPTQPASGHKQHKNKSLSNKAVTVPRSLTPHVHTTAPKTVLVVYVAEVRERPHHDSTTKSHEAITATAPQTVCAVVGYGDYSFGVSAPLAQEATITGSDSDLVTSCEPIVFPHASAVTSVPLAALDTNQLTTTATTATAASGSLMQISEAQQKQQQQLRVQVIFADSSSRTRTVGYALVRLPAAATATAERGDVWLPLLSERTVSEGNTKATRHDPHRLIGEVRVCWTTVSFSCGSRRSDDVLALQGADTTTAPSLPLPHLGVMTTRALPMKQTTTRVHTTHDDDDDVDDKDASDHATTNRSASLAESSSWPTRHDSDAVGTTTAAAAAAAACEYAIVQAIQWVPAPEQNKTASARWKLRVRAAGSGAHERLRPKHTEETSRLPHASPEAVASTMYALEPTVDDVVLHPVQSTATRHAFTAATVTATPAFAHDATTTATRTDRPVPVDALVVPFLFVDPTSATKTQSVPFGLDVLEATAASEDTWQVVGHADVVHHVPHETAHTPASSPSAERYSLAVMSVTPDHEAKPIGQLSFSVITAASPIRHWACVDEAKQTTTATATRSEQRPLPRPAAALFHVALTDLKLHSPTQLPREVRLVSTPGSPSVAVMLPTALPDTSQWEADICVHPNTDQSDTLCVCLETCQSTLSLSAPWTIGQCEAPAETLTWHDHHTNACVGTASLAWRLLGTTDDLYDPRQLFFTRRATLRVTGCAGLVQGDVESLRVCAAGYQQLRGLAASRHQAGKRLSERHRKGLSSARAALDALVVRASMDAVLCARSDGATSREAIRAAMQARGFALDLFAPDPDVSLAQTHTRAFRAPTALHVLSHCRSLAAPIQEADVPPVVPLPQLPARPHHDSRSHNSSSHRNSHTSGDDAHLLQATFEVPFSVDPAVSPEAKTLTIQLHSCRVPDHRNGDSLFVRGGGALGRGEWVVEPPSSLETRPTVEHQLVRLGLFASPDQGLTLYTSALWQTVVQRGDATLRCLRVRVPARLLGSRSAHLKSTRVVPMRVRFTYGFPVANSEVYQVDMPFTVRPRPTSAGAEASVACEWTTSCVPSRVPRVGSFGGRLRAVELFLDAATQPEALSTRASKEQRALSGEGVAVGYHEWTCDDEQALFSTSTPSRGEVRWITCTPSGSDAAASSCAILLCHEPLTTTTAAATAAAAAQTSGSDGTDDLDEPTRLLCVEDAELEMAGDVGVASAVSCRCSCVAASAPWRCVLAQAPACALSRTVVTRDDDAPAELEASAAPVAAEAVQADTITEEEHKRDDDDDEDDEKSEEESGEATPSHTTSDDEDDEDEEMPSSASSDFSAFGADEEADEAAREKAREKDAKRKAREEKRAAKALKANTKKAKVQTNAPGKRQSNAMAELQNILARAAGTTPATTAVATTVSTVPSPSHPAGAPPTAAPRPGDVSASRVWWSALPLLGQMHDDDDDRSDSTSPMPAPPPHSLYMVPVTSAQTQAAHPFMVIVRAAAASQTENTPVVTSTGTASDAVYVAFGSVENMVDSFAAAPPVEACGVGVSSWPVFRVTDAAQKASLHACELAGSGRALTADEAAGCAAVWTALQSGDATAQVGTLTMRWRLRSNGPTLTTNAGSGDATTAPAAPTDAEAPRCCFVNAVSDDTDDGDGDAVADQRDRIHRLFHATLSDIVEEAEADNDARGDGLDARGIPEDRHGSFLALQRDLTGMALAHREEEATSVETWLDRLSAVHAARRAERQEHPQEWDWVVRAVHVDGLQLARFGSERDRTRSGTPPLSSRSRTTTPTTPTTTRIGDLVVRVTPSSRAGLSPRARGDAVVTTTPAPTLLCELSLFDPRGEDSTAMGEVRAEAELTSPKELSLTAANMRSGVMEAAATRQPPAPEWVLGVARAEATVMPTTANAPFLAIGPDTDTNALFQTRFHDLAWCLTPHELTVDDVRASAMLTLWQLVQSERAGEGDAPPTAACLGEVSLSSILTQLASFTRTTASATQTLSAVSAWLPLQSATSGPGQTSPSSGLAQTQARVRVRFARVPHTNGKTTTTTTVATASGQTQQQHPQQQVAVPPMAPFTCLTRGGAQRLAPAPTSPSPSGTGALSAAFTSTRSGALLTLCGQIEGISVVPTRSATSASAAASALPPLALLASYSAGHAADHSSRSGDTSGLFFSTHVLPVQGGSRTGAAAAAASLVASHGAGGAPRPPQRASRSSAVAATVVPAPVTTGQATPVSVLPTALPAPVPVPTPVVAVAAPGVSESKAKTAASASASLTSSSVSTPESGATNESTHAGKLDSDDDNGDHEDNDEDNEGSQAASQRPASTVAGRSDGGRREGSALPVAREVDLDAADHDDEVDDGDAKKHAPDTANASLFESFDEDDEDDENDVRSKTPATATATTTINAEQVLIPVHTLFCWQQSIPVPPPATAAAQHHGTDASIGSSPAPHFHLVRTSSSCSSPSTVTTAPESRLGAVRESQVASLLGDAPIPQADWEWLVSTVASHLASGELEPVTLHTEVTWCLADPAVRVTVRLFVFVAPAASLTRAVAWIAEQEEKRQTLVEAQRRTATTTAGAAFALPRVAIAQETLAVDPVPVGPGSAMCTLLLAAHDASHPAKVLTLLLGGLLGPSQRVSYAGGDGPCVRQLAWSRAWSALAAEWDAATSTTTLSECEADPERAAVALWSRSTNSKFRREDAPHGCGSSPGSRVRRPLTAVPQRGVLRTVRAERPYAEDEETASAWRFAAVMPHVVPSRSTVVRTTKPDLARLLGNRTGHVVIAYERLVDESDCGDATAAAGAQPPRRQWVVVVDGGLAHVPTTDREAIASLTSLPASQRASGKTATTKPSGTTVTAAMMSMMMLPSPPSVTLSTAEKASRRSAPTRLSQSSLKSPAAMSTDALQQSRSPQQHQPHQQHQKQHYCSAQTARVQPLELRPCATLRWNTTLREFTHIGDCLVPRGDAASPTARKAALQPVSARYVHHTGVIVGTTLWLMGGWRVTPLDDQETQADALTLTSRLLLLLRDDQSELEGACESTGGGGGLVARRRSEVQRASLLAAPSETARAIVANGQGVLPQSTPTFYFDDRDDSESADRQRLNPTMCHFGLHSDMRTLDLSTHAEASVPVLLQSLSHAPLVRDAPSKRGPACEPSLDSALLEHLTPLETTPQIACHVAMTSGEWIVLFGGLVPTETVWDDEAPLLAATDAVYVFHTRSLRWYRHQRDSARRRTTSTAAGAQKRSVDSVTKSKTGQRRGTTHASEEQNREDVAARVQQWPLARYGHAVAVVPTSKSTIASPDVKGEDKADKEDTAQNWATFVIYGGATTTISTGHQWLVPSEEVVWVCHIRTRDALVRWQRVQLPASGPLTPRFMPSLQIVPIPASLAKHAEANRAIVEDAATSLPSPAVVITRTPQPQRSGGGVISIADLCATAPTRVTSFALVVSGGSMERSTPYSSATTQSPVAAGATGSIDASMPSMSMVSTQQQQQQQQRTPATTPMKAPAISVETPAPCAMYNAFVENWLGGAPLGTAFVHMRLEES